MGSGGREYAMAWKLFKYQNINEIHCIPGNGGTKDFVFNHTIDTSDCDLLLKFVEKNNIDLTIVGPENLLDEVLLILLKSLVIQNFWSNKICFKT